MIGESHQGREQLADEGVLRTSPLSPTTRPQPGGEDPERSLIVARGSCKKETILLSSWMLTESWNWEPCSSLGIREMRGRLTHP